MEEREERRRYGGEREGRARGEGEREEDRESERYIKRQKREGDIVSHIDRQSERDGER